MHRILVTQGIVLSKRTLGEANTHVSILTLEAGLLRAKATSTRAERSTLRNGLEPFPYARYSFVQGRYEWKLTGVENISRDLLPALLPARGASGRILLLLLRLIHGPE